MSESPIISLRDVRRDYALGAERVHALQGVSMAVARGDYVAIVGPSGCGKSTLLNLIGVIDQPTSGTVTIDGKRVDDMGDREATQFRLRNIGFVFQRFYLMPILSALENVALPMAEAGVPKDERVKRATDGYYMAPTLFVDANNSMRISREEIFGPVACVIRAKNYDEALAMANDTDTGLSAGIVTTSLKYASHFKRHAQAGMVMVNLPTAGVDYHVPFGGRKGSSYGPREQGRYAAEFYTTVKTTYLAP